MTALLALRGINEDRADAYGVLSAATWNWFSATDWSYSTPIGPGWETEPRNQQISALHLLITAKQGAATDHVLYEVSFDSDDIEGTYIVPGHSYVVGLWLTSYTLTGNTCTPPPAGLSPTAAIEAYLPDPTIYVVPEGAHMYRRP
jgi:hypothetical protein